MATETVYICDECGKEERKEGFFIPEGWFRAEYSWDFKLCDNKLNSVLNHGNLFCSFKCLLAHIEKNLKKAGVK